MLDDEKLLAKRLSELSERAYSRGTHEYSDFLSLSGQDVLLKTKLSCEAELIGGYDTAERKIACFFPKDCYYEETPPISYISITPLSQKFADKLTHRDFLGSLTGLGIRREVLGDIIISENIGYLVCKEEIAEYIEQTLIKVKHTDVKCKIVDSLPKVSVELPEPSFAVVSSERIDSIVAAVFCISRSDSQDLFAHDKVFISGRLAQSLTASPKAGDIISVRGFGRFVYEGIERETKKGRLRVKIRIFK